MTRHALHQACGGWTQHGHCQGPAAPRATSSFPGLPDGPGTVVDGGFLGAYTTCSTAMDETAQLVENGATAPAIGNLIIPLAASVTAATLGWAVVAA